MIFDLGICDIFFDLCCGLYLRRSSPFPDFRYQNMLVGWYMIPEENFALQAEVAFVARHDPPAFSA